MTTTNAKASEVTTFEGSQEKNQPVDFIPLYAQRKAMVLAELTAQGHTVHQGPNADFTVSRWGLSKYCTDLAALEEFAYRTGAKR